VLFLIQVHLGSKFRRSFLQTTVLRVSALYNVCSSKGRPILRHSSDANNVRSDVVILDKNIFLITLTNGNYLTIRILTCQRLNCVFIIHNLVFDRLNCVFM
jgi:hypothetical protein